MRRAARKEERDESLIKFVDENDKPLAAIISESAKKTKADDEERIHDGHDDCDGDDDERIRDGDDDERIRDGDDEDEERIRDCDGDDYERIRDCDGDDDERIRDGDDEDEERIHDGDDYEHQSKLQSMESLKQLTLLLFIPYLV